MSALREAARNIASSTPGGEDEFADLLVELAPEVNQYLAGCVPAGDSPEDPMLNPTNEQHKAWVDACSLKSFAGDATAQHIRVMAQHIRRKKRRDGQPVSHGESLSLAHGLVDYSLTSPTEKIAAALLESRE